MSGAGDRRAAYVRALREQLREYGESRAEDQVALDLMEELLPYLAGETDPPPALTARLFRFYTDTGDLELAEKHRAHLHRHAEAGDRVALEVLTLLSDDPFWREP